MSEEYSCPTQGVQLNNLGICWLILHEDSVSLYV